ncbi:hypothetical protein DVH24_027404 [Malus domestica]|uniref:Uncharacterized protein n=1 Tax=Malus domestica TaxID=3750 RepID=A0A498HAJ0_MALDO|nr:hypothetical protein DVH24_027404 [Malus domestica]
MQLIRFSWAVTSQSRLHHSTILSALDPGHAFTVLFLGTHSRTSQWVIHPRIAFMESEVSEFPKSLVLYGGRHVHIRHITPSSLVDGPDVLIDTLTPHSRVALIPFCHIPISDSAVTRYCQLWAPAMPSRFCFWKLTRELLPSGSPILGLLSPELA